MAIVYKFRNSLAPSLSQQYFRTIAKKIRFVADPSYARNFLFVFEDDVLKGCLGFYTTQLASLWVDESVRGLGCGTEMIKLLTMDILETYPQLSHVLLLLLEKETDEQQWCIDAGMRAVGTKTAGDGSVYTVYRKDR